MKFDQTYIAIRKRSILEIMDLSFHVVRDYFAPLSVLWLLGTLPFMVLNWFLIGWMADDYYDYEMLFTYLLFSGLLILVEAQMATTFLTTYLGQAIFAQRPTIWIAIKSTFAINPYYVVVHGLFRLVIPALLLLLLLNAEMDRDAFIGYSLLLTLLVGVALLVRCFRPFASEILALERTPIRKKQDQINYALRSSSLHRAASSELVGRFILTTLVAIPLVFTITGTLLILDYLLNLFSAAEYLPLTIYTPIAMWLVVGLFAVVRFLSYIDIRIRQEGWEVELRLRAEAIRLAQGAA